VRVSLGSSCGFQKPNFFRRRDSVHSHLSAIIRSRACYGGRERCPRVKVHGVSGASVSYSARSAIIGLILVTRRAGSQQASTAITPKSSVTAENTTGSNESKKP
jgi:hypothetical protein